MVHANDTHHAQTGHGNQTGIINRRNTLDRFRRMVSFLLHNGTRSLRIERILYQNRNILMTHRINRRRIHHFRTKVTQLHSLHITQLRNRISRADDTRVSCHKAIHIRPDFQNIRIQSCRNNGRCIVRSTSSQVSYFSRILIGRNKSRHQRNLRYFTESLTHQPVRQLWIKNMLIMFLFGLNESTGIEPHCPLNKSSHNDGRKTFPIAHNRSRSFRRKVTNQINTLKNILQFAQQFVHQIQKQLSSPPCRNHSVHHFNVTVHDFLHFLLISVIARSGHFRSTNQFIGNSP